MRTLLLTSSIFFLFLVSCEEKQGFKNEETIYITAHQESNRLLYSQVFEHLDYTILDTNDSV